MENRRNPMNMTSDDMIRELYHWAFGNGRPGIEQRVGLLETGQKDNATRSDIGCIETDVDGHMQRLEQRVELRIQALDQKIDESFRALTRQLNAHEVIKLMLIIGTIVAATRGVF